MANSKISALTGATTPLAGTETLPIVQGGVTKQVSVANLTSGRAVNTAGGTFTNNQTQGTAAKGINFTANTPAAGMTSQLLNWYEEGTWTPTQGANLIVVGAFSSSGTYKRVGKIVFVTGTLSGVTSIAWNSSASEVCAGLPFVSALNATGTAFNQSFNASATLVSNSSSLLAAEALGATPAAKFSITYSV